MAQIRILKDTDTGTTIYPVTTPEAVYGLDTLLSQKVDKVPGKGLSTNDYDNASKTKLDNLPNRDSLDASLGSKQNVLQPSPDITSDPRTNQLSLTQSAKMALFIDQWNRACGTYGRYDPDNAPDPQHPFYLNALWLTYEEASRCYEYTLLNFMQNQIDYYATNHVITNIPIVGGSITRISNSFNWSTPRCFNFVKWFPQLFLVSLNSCTNLETILNLNFEYCTSVDSNFLKGAVNLKTLDLSNLKISIDINDSPLISLASIRYMIEHAANTSAITITVHPDVYAKLTDETNEEWHKVLTDAVEKNINFATI